MHKPKHLSGILRNGWWNPLKTEKNITSLKIVQTGPISNKPIVLIKEKQFAGKGFMQMLIDATPFKWSKWSIILLSFIVA